jgi:hypothetical protein
VNRFETRTSTVTRGLVICGLVAAAALAGCSLTGCSAGQQAQTAVMEPAVNGSYTTVGTIALRDVRMRAVQTSDALNPGKPVELVLVVVNTSPDASDTLVGVSTDIGQVAISGDATVPPIGTLLVGTPDRQGAVALSDVAPARTAKATVTLTRPISNGLVYTFTFRFAKAGETKLGVPISAGAEAPRQQQVAATGGAAGP